MKGDFSVYEIRIFMKIVEHANHLIQGERVSKLIGKAICTDGINCNFSVPLKEIGGDTHHGDEFKKALHELHNKDIEFYDTNTHTWHLCSVIDNINIIEGDSTLYFTTPRWLINYILNFINGNFTMYDLQAAMSLPSAYAVRMYWIVCNQSRPLKFSIAILRQMLGVPDNKYNTTKDFVKRCVETPQHMLEERNLNGFNYKMLKGEHGKAYKYIEIAPVKRQLKSPSQEVAGAALGAWCDPILRQYLTNQCNFTIKELSPHKDLLMKYSHIEKWQEKIVMINERARKGRKGKGYIINAMKSEVNENERI